MGGIYYLTPSRQYLAVVLAPGDNCATFTWPGPPDTSPVPTTSMEAAWRNECKAGVDDGLPIKHMSVGQVNGEDFIVGTGTGGDFRLPQRGHRSLETDREHAR